MAALSRLLRGRLASLKGEQAECLRRVGSPTWASRTLRTSCAEWHGTEKEASSSDPPLGQRGLVRMDEGAFAGCVVKSAPKGVAIGEGQK